MHSVYNNRKPIGLKLLTRLRLGLSHVNEHRFNHNFENCVNPLCIYLYSLEAETTSHFFLYCHYYHLIRLTLFINELWEIDMNLPNLSEKKFLNIILYGSSHFSDSQNQSILNSTIKYITDSNHFSRPIFWSGGRYHFYILMVYVCIALGKVFSFISNSLRT